MRICSFAQKTSSACISLLATLAILSAGLFTCPAYAEESASTTDTLSIPASGLITDYTGSNSLSALSTNSTYPSALDLRYYGGTYTYNEELGRNVFTGGWSYVTPVKSQNPFGTCWAFAITAASETSLLSALDKADNGEMDGSTNYETAAASAPGSLALSIYNLSERHLAYFAYGHQPDDSDQAGEGKYLTSGSTKAVDYMNSGGTPLLGATIYASGVGPVPDQMAPYISDENLIETLEIYEKDGATRIKIKYFQGSTSLESYSMASRWAYGYEDEEGAWVSGYWTAERKAEALSILANMGYTYTEAELDGWIKPCISTRGTWEIDDSLMYGVVAELDNSNVIASNRVTDPDDPAYGALTSEEISLMKQELLEGHALSIAYAADQSLPGQAISEEGSYLNTATWGQYTYETASPTHSVTIVGYDDDYAASNFTHTILDANGNETTEGTTPAGNGAWIVKNSWGSSDNSNPLYQTDWGVDGSGYFYLSYYDKTITSMESYEFDLSEEAQARTGYGIFQYDCAECNYIISSTCDAEYKMVNVFGEVSAEEAAQDTEQDTEATDTWEVIRDLGCMTGAPNDTVTLEVYVIDVNANTTETIDAGQATAIITEKFDNAGFHRLHLDSGIVIKDDQKIAVVQTTQRANDKYEQTFTFGYAKEFADAYSQAGYGTLPHYTVAVVNPGESWECSDGTWTDWSAARTLVDAAEVECYAQQGLTVSSVMAIDNWTIKAYADEALRGDVNQSGSLNVVDAQIAYDIATTQAYESRTDYATMYALADVVGTDGVVDAGDARAIQYAVLYGWN